MEYFSGREFAALMGLVFESVAIKGSYRRAHSITNPKGLSQSRPAMQ
jgi:hypothetical protein